MPKPKHGPDFKGYDETKRAFGVKLSAWMHANQEPERRKRSSDPTSWAQLAARINERVESDGTMTDSKCSNTTVMSWAKGKNAPTGVYRRAFESVTGIPWPVWSNPKARLPERGSDYERGCFAFTRGSAAEVERLLSLLGREPRDPRR